MISGVELAKLGIKTLTESINNDTDIIGPINDSITGKKFILTEIDEKSHKIWIFLMKSKSETIDLLIDFIKIFYFFIIKNII